MLEALIEVTVVFIEVESAHPLGSALARLQHVLSVGIEAAKFLIVKHGRLLWVARGKKAVVC